MIDPKLSVCIPLGYGKLTLGYPDDKKATTGPRMIIKVADMRRQTYICTMHEMTVLNATESWEGG
jgi:hypothetical protein